jgi:D-arabinitol 4-dehydrogenase
MLRFLQRWSREALPYAHQDQSINVRQTRAIVTAADPVSALCSSPQLFGDVADNTTLIEAVRGAYALTAWVDASR